MKSGYLGRYQAVRPYGPYSNGWGLPCILDRKEGRLLPRRGVPMGCSREGILRDGEWWRSPDGTWLPVIAGGLAISRYSYPHLLVPGFPAMTSSGSQSSQALATAFTYGASGQSAAWNLTPPTGAGTAKTINSVYLYFTAVAGTAPQVTFDIRSGSQVKPGSTQVTNAAINLTLTNSTAGWYQFAYGGSKPSVTFSVGDVWPHVYNSDPVDPTTRTCTVLTGAGPASTSTNQNFLSTITPMIVVTDGYAAANPTPLTVVSTIVVLLSDGTFLGWPMSQAGNVTGVTNDANYKGWYLGGFTGSIKIWGMQFVNTQVSTLNGLRLFDSVTAPNGAAIATGTAIIKSGVSASNPQGIYFDADQTLTAATVYRLVFGASASFQAPMKHAIGTVVTGNLSDLQSAMWDGGASYYANATGPNTSWSDDNTALPLAEVLLADLVASSGGGMMAARQGY